MKNSIKILSSPIFLSSLVLMVLNDHVLKGEFHNFLTGKLSDFTGLFCLVILCGSMFPRNRKWAYGLVAIFFIYLKSPYSEEFVQIIDWISPFGFTRVVDLGDLMALAILPIAYHYQFLIFPRISEKHFLRISPVLPLLVSCLGFIATSPDDKFGNCYSVSGTYEFDVSSNDLKQQMRDNYYTETEPQGEGPDSFLLEYRTSIQGDTARIQCWMTIASPTDSTSIMDIYQFCSNTLSEFLLEEVSEDFEVKVISELGSDG